MSNPIKAPAGTWALIAGPGFGTKGVQAGTAVRWTLSAGTPPATDVSSGHYIRSGERDTPGTDDASLGLYFRAADPSQDGYVSVLS